MSGEVNLTDTEPGRQIFREQMELLTPPIRLRAQEEAKDLPTDHNAALSQHGRG